MSSLYFTLIINPPEYLEKSRNHTVIKISLHILHTGDPVCATCILRQHGRLADSASGKPRTLANPALRQPPRFGKPRTSANPALRQTPHSGKPHIPANPALRQTPHSGKPRTPANPTFRQTPHSCKPNSSGEQFCEASRWLANIAAWFSSAEGIFKLRGVTFSAYQVFQHACCSAVDSSGADGVLV